MDACRSCSHYPEEVDIVNEHYNTNCIHVTATDSMFTKMALIQPYDGVGSPVTPHFRGNLLTSAPISNFRHNVLFVFCCLTHFMTESLLSPHANIILPSVVELICLTLSFLTISSHSKLSECKKE